MNTNDLRKQVLKPPISSRKASREEQQDLTPLAWDKFFSHKVEIRVEHDIFCVYNLKQQQYDVASTPVIFLLHGGGFSGLTWSQFAAHLFAEYNCEIYAMDIRGHGETEAEDEYKLSIGTMTADVINVIDELQLWSRKLVFIGHSLGGAVAINIVLILQNQQSYAAGLVVLDVVEGSAMESLTTMPIVLRSRPRGFETLETAIRWSLKTGHTRNSVSARVSMPGQLVYSLTNETASRFVDDYKKVGMRPKSNGAGTSKQTEKEVVKVDETKAGHSDPISLVAVPETYSLFTRASPLSLQAIPEQVSITDQLEEALPTAKAEDGSLNAVAADDDVFKKPISPSVTTHEPSSLESVLPSPHSTKLPPSLKESSEDVPSSGPGSPRLCQDITTTMYTVTSDTTSNRYTNCNFTWRTQLMETEQFWPTWFRGLSKKFLDVTCPKQLILAGTDRLDTEMLVAHMQGKFENQLLPNCGHVIQEDDPEGSARLVGKFLVRHKVTTTRDVHLPLRRTEAGRVTLVRRLVL